MEREAQDGRRWRDAGEPFELLPPPDGLSSPDLFESDDPFTTAYGRIYRHQAARHPVYGAFTRNVMRRHGFPEPAMEPATEPADKTAHGPASFDVPPFDHVPLIPIRVFREADMALASPSLPRPAGPEDGSVFFQSSGTTGQRRSHHHVLDPRLYVRSVLRGFRHVYGDAAPPVMGYLPGYVDNPHSSLVAMLRILDGERGGPGVHADPAVALRILREWEGRPLVLFGAAFGLLDLVDAAPGGRLHLAPGSIVLETGGMKTRRREIPREELHRRLSDGLGIEPNHVHSEYSMCEMLSQAYCRDGQWFEPVPWLRFQVRHPDRPFEACRPGQEGKLGFIDLANVHSCSFVLTDDRAVLDEAGRATILGRWERTPSRGCNYMVDID